MWQGPTEDKIREWAACANKQIASDARVVCRCPTCRNGDLAVFFLRGHRHGAAWLWCSSCHTGYHSQSTVPAWWRWPFGAEEVRRAEDPFSLLEKLWPQISQLNPPAH